MIIICVGGVHSWSFHLFFYMYISWSLSKGKSVYSMSFHKTDIKYRLKKKYIYLTMENQPLLENCETGKIENSETDKAKTTKAKQEGNTFTKSLPFLIAMAFMWRFLVAVSKICVQALQNRVPTFELNTIRCGLMLCVMSCGLMLCVMSCYFLFKWKLPIVERENIKVTLLWSVNHISSSLVAFSSVIFLPLATAETISILSNIVSAILIYTIVMKYKADWSQVIHRLHLFFKYFLFPSGTGLF